MNEKICYGHALSETSGWYSDFEYFIDNRYPWLSRGGAASTAIAAGVFDSDLSTGIRRLDLSSRFVITP